MKELEVAERQRKTEEVESKRRETEDMRTELEVNLSKSVAG